MLFEKDNYQEKIDKIKKAIDDADAVFIGASDMYTSFIPGRAYEKYGFTS